MTKKTITLFILLALIGAGNIKAQDTYQGFKIGEYPSSIGISVYNWEYINTEKKKTKVFFFSGGADSQTGIIATTGTISTTGVGTLDLGGNPIITLGGIIRKQDDSDLSGEPGISIGQMEREEEADGPIADAIPVIVILALLYSIKINRTQAHKRKNYETN